MKEVKERDAETFLSPVAASSSSPSKSSVTLTWESTREREKRERDMNKLKKKIKEANRWWMHSDERGGDFLSVNESSLPPAFLSLVLFYCTFRLWERRAWRENSSKYTIRLNPIMNAMNEEEVKERRAKKREQQQKWWWRTWFARSKFILLLFVLYHVVLLINQSN